MSEPELAEPPTVSKRPKALSQAAVVEAIRQGILADKLVPGQRLVEAELCELLGASRGTVRAALVDLVHEGLVERIADRGARVRVVGLQEALHIVEVRSLVESLCVARAAERITDAEIKRLRLLAKQLKDRAKQGDVQGFADLTHEIFETYVHVAAQPVAMEVLERLRDRNTPHRFRLTYRPGRPQVSLPYWLDIVAAICNRDPGAAQGALHAHVENVKDAMKSLANEQTPFAIVPPDTDTYYE